MIEIEGVKINSKSIYFIGDANKLQSIFFKIFFIEDSSNHSINNLSMGNQNIEDINKFYKENSLVMDWGGLLSNKSLRENILLQSQFAGKDISSYLSEVEAIFSELKYEDYLDMRPFYVPLNVRKLTCILKSLALSPKRCFIDNLSLGLLDSEKGIISHFLEKKIESGLVLIYSDSCSNIHLKNTEKVYIDKKIKKAV